MASLAQMLARLSDIIGVSAHPIPLANRNFIVDPGLDNGTTLSAVALPTSVSGYSTPYFMYKGGAGAGGVATGQIIGLLPVAGMYPRTRFGYRHTQTTASTGTVAAQTAPAFWQPIEFAKTLSGRSATFSCWLRASAPITIPNLILQQAFGTGGAPSANVILNPAVNWQVGTTLKRFSVRIDLPDASAATLGSSGNDSLNIGLWLPPGITFTLDTAQWQLEETSPNAPPEGMATAFEYRGLETEVFRAQRYFVADVMGFMGSANVANATVGGFYTLPQAMRVTPTLANTGTIENVNCGAIQLTQYSPRVIRVWTNALAAGSTFFEGNYIFDARI